MKKLVHPGSTSTAASKVGRANTKVDTKPEKRARSLLHRRGYRFRKNYYIRLPGRRGVRPDIVFTKQKLAIFIDGCFWHGCPEHGTLPMSNVEYWQLKLHGNAKRDFLDSADLVRQGWRVLRIWEHVSPEDTVDQIITELDRSAFSPSHSPAPPPSRLRGRATSFVDVSP